MHLLAQYQVISLKRICKNAHMFVQVNEIILSTQIYKGSIFEI